MKHYRDAGVWGQGSYCLPVLGKLINSISTRGADYAPPHCYGPPRFLNGASTLSNITFINFENKCVHMYIINAMEHSIPDYNFMLICCHNMQVFYKVYSL